MMWFMVLFLGYSLTYPEENTIFPFLARVKTNNLNLRTGPNINYPSLTQLMKEKVLNIVGRKYSWFKVQLPPKVNCYVKKEYVERRQGKAFSKVDNLNVRSGPGLKHGIVGELDKGEYLYIKAKNKGWLKTYPNKSCYGWIHKKHVEKIEATKQEKIALKKENYSYIKNLKREKSSGFEPISIPKTKSAEKSSQEEKDTSKKKEVKKKKTKKYPSHYKKSIGYIKDLGILFHRPGTHKLVDNRDNLRYYLESEKRDLNNYMYGKVKVIGEEKVNMHYKIPTLKVKKIKYIKK